jgi:aromatic-L-amino-acid/L-tryptophan decarboxylase
MTDSQQFRADGHAAIDWAADYLEGIRERPVMSTVAPGDIRAQLPASPPEGAEPFADVLADLDRVLMPGITHWNHPRFFAYFSITASAPGILAELLAATLNANGMLWRTSPAVTELEELTLSWLGQLLDLPAAWHGHIEDSASTSTLAALCAARTAMPDRRVVVASGHAHSSVDRACRILGLEIRHAPVDDAYRMRVDAIDLSDACAVVATVGTTSTTSVDPVPEIADAAAATGAWLHVDAAYGGSARVCPEFRTPGLERADSLVVNPHKWLFTPIDCSCLFSARPDDLRAAFALTPEYLRTSAADGVTNLNEYGPALGRRFRALKLWAVLRCFGRAGLQAKIREHVRLAEQFEGWVRDEPGWEVCAPRPYSTVCFRPEGDDARSEALLEAVNADGEVYLSHTRLNDRHVLRLAIGNAQTEESDVRSAWDVLRREAALLGANGAKAAV